MERRRFNSNVRDRRGREGQPESSAVLSGEILLQNANIRDDLSFIAARLASTNGPVLVAIGLTVGGTL
jgi:hypothetical protein